MLSEKGWEALFENLQNEDKGCCRRKEKGRFKRPAQALSVIEGSRKIWLFKKRPVFRV
ncbi:hypothetical protein X474_19505 [Dethiosulfatarculus sandiegensis]|uniref:Uncharacterized protein n=1 Tax=Dethiosulfatarculus sandiegensis TaxID=1429043 RepID=A0A0D2J2F2_9BACT|nr:hypothetical protein X474_19505 [Dethiosulfatarculus sandiegensis]